MNKKPIRVLLVEDSPVALIILKRILNSSPEIEIVGTARTGKEALELIPKVQPEVICTDLYMPQMDGLELTREVMATCPRPILVISASVQEEDSQNVFRLLEAGAVDIFPKPCANQSSDYEATRQALIGKIKVLSGVAVFTRHRRPTATGVGKLASRSEVGDRRRKGEPMCSSTPEAQQGSRKEVFSAKTQSPLSTPHVVKAIAIGASTGGPQALHTILSQLPATLPIPVICVQHISEGFLQGLVDWLTCECSMPVKIANAGEFPKVGTIYFPPESRHLELDIQGRFVYSSLPPVSGHRPSVTVTFKSVANFYGRAAAGVLLTGMGRDGADGLLAIAQAGGLTIAQDEASCVVFGMPKEAIALGAAQHILPANEIAPLLLKKLKIR